MGSLFLINKAIDIGDYGAFKNGLNNLLSIKKKKDHIFRKHESVWHLPFYEKLCATYGQEEQAILKFIEQLKPCESYIDSEQKANNFCASAFNGFLGIDFTDIQIPKQKQVTDNKEYIEWNYLFLSNEEKLNVVLESCTTSSNFKKDFDSFHNDVQQSIIEDFRKAKGRGLVTPFYPDTKIISDVTPKNAKHKVLELRVYTPTALRVYFNVTAGKVHLASIGLKSNSNQNDDIKAAHKVLENLITTQ